MKYRVAVVGGGPSGSCAAEILAECDDVEVTLFERKMDNAKPCGGAIPLCMIDEFDLPTDIIDRKVQRNKLCRAGSSGSPSDLRLRNTLRPDICCCVNFRAY